MFNKILNVIIVLLCVTGLVFVFYTNHNYRIKQTEQNDKLYNELINVKLSMNKNALTIQGVQNIINNIHESVREKNKEQAFMIAEEIVNTANRYNTITPSFLTAMIYVESRFNVDAVSSEGAQGLVQIMPETVAWICREWNINNSKDLAFDPVFNIRASAWYYDWLYKNVPICRLDKEKATAYYNGGARQSYRWGLYRKKLNGLSLDSLEHHYLNKLSSETKNYVHEVIKNDTLFNKKIINELPVG